MNYPIRSIEEMFVSTKKELASQGIALENIDAVAAILAGFKLQSHNDGNAAKKHAIPQTFGEWAGGFTLDSHYDRFLAVAVYLFEQKEVQTITTADIVGYYDKARWDKPKNCADVFAKSAQKMLFTENETEEGKGIKGQWTITQTGYDYFQGLKKEN